MASWVFLLQRQTSCEQVRSWGLEIVSASFIWAPRESGCSCPCGERWRDVVCALLSTGGVLYSSLTFLTVLLVNLFLIHFFYLEQAWNDWVGSGKAWHQESSQGALSAIIPTGDEGILQSGKAWTPGGTECPQLSLESAGLRSFIPKAQSRYSLIERCPAEKDFSFSS